MTASALIDQFDAHVLVYMRAMIAFDLARKVNQNFQVLAKKEPADDIREGKWTHASGDVECHRCAMPNRSHPTDPRVSFLHVLCDGERVKL